jgi:hypothetical protein
MTTLKKLEIEGKYLKIIKDINDSLLVNIILNKDKLKPFPLKSGMRQRRLLLFSNSIRIPSQSNKTREINKRDSNSDGKNQIVLI